MAAAHIFENGVRICRRHIIPAQFERYARRNVHEHEEEDIFIAAIAALPPCAVFFNIGCAVGYYALLAKKLRPDLVIHCFEPLPRHREFFLENIALNEMRREDFSIHPFAISGRCGPAVLVDRGFGSSLIPERVSDSCIAVDCFTLTEAADRLHCSTVDLVQMDVQGGELDILEELLQYDDGAKAPRVEAFLIGTHGTQVHNGCANLLSAAMYEIVANIPKPCNQPDGILLARAKSAKGLGLRGAS